MRAVLIIPLLLVVTLRGRAVSSEWSLFSLADGANTTIENFDAERDVLFVPPLEGRDFFASIGDLSVLRRSAVRGYVYHYQTSGRRYVTDAVMRAGRYMQVIEEIFERNRDLPADLKLLPLLESGFNPHAVSRSNAVGPWQFLNGTAALLGISNNAWVDERKSLHRSTEAAVKHLRSLYRTFNSWELALAAYNGGAGYVRRAMNRYGTRDFWELRAKGGLRAETAEYVPRFAALAVLYRNADLFMPDGTAPSLTARMRLVEFEYPADLRKIAKVTGAPLELLHAYNPEIRKNITPPNSIRYTLLIPEEVLEPLARNIDRVYVMKLSRIATCRVRKGDTLGRIAKKYNVTTASIIMLNDLRNPRRLRRGQEILIPQ
jgi:membrane-bound lytic murein transglycosylase D